MKDPRHPLQKKRYQSLIGGVILLTLFVLLYDGPPDPLKVAPGQPTREADAFFTNSTYISFNEAGIPGTVLKSEKATHFPDDGHAELKNPDATILNKNNKPWHLTSRWGRYHVESKDLVVWDDVDVIMPEGPAGTTELLTEVLYYTDATRMVTTDLPVEVTSGKSVMTAEGMDMSIDSETVELKREVRGSREK